MKRPSTIAERVEEAVAIAAEAYDIPVKQMLSKDRHQTPVNARRLAAHFMREYTDLSLPDIGRILNCNHTSILRSLRAMESEKEDSPNYAQWVRDWEKTYEDYIASKRRPAPKGSGIK